MGEGDSISGAEIRLFYLLCFLSSWGYNGAKIFFREVGLEILCIVCIYVNG